MNGRFLGGLGIAVALGGSGCSSSYQPARSPRAALVLDDGAPAVVRDGENKGGFSFGGGVVDAVQGNPRAEKEARLGRNLVIGGFVLELGGLAVETGGLIYAIDNPRDRSTGPTLALSGLALVTAGFVMFLNGQPHLYDALNIYNDDLDAAAWRAHALPQAYPGSPAPPALPSQPPQPSQALPPAPPAPPVLPAAPSPPAPARPSP